MKLLYKLGGLALVPAFFFSCEEATELGADFNPLNQKVETYYVEIPLEISQIKLDSVVTNVSAAAGGTGTVLLGRTQDDNFGEQEAIVYLGLFKENALEGSGNNELIKTELQLAYSQAPFGRQLSKRQLFHVYSLQNKVRPNSYTEISDDSNVDADVQAIYRNYTTEKQQLGELITTIELDLNSAIAAPPANRDTTLTEDKRLITAELPEAFGQAILSYLETDDGPGIQGFQNQFPGLAIVPDAGNTFINSYNLTSSFSYLKITYSPGVGNDEELILRFYPRNLRVDTDYTDGYNDTIYSNSSSYYAVESNFFGTPLTFAALAGNRQEFQTTDNRLYYQPLAGIYPRISFFQFEDFLTSDTIDNLIINRAVLQLDTVRNYKEGTSLSSQRIPSDLTYFPVENSNRRFINNRGQLEASNSPLYGLRDENDFIYNLYQINVLGQLEQFRQTGNARYLQGIFYPGASPQDLARLSAERSKLKLRIWYTNFID